MRNDTDIGVHIIEPIEVFGIDKFAGGAVVIGGRFKTLPGKQWAVGREFNRRVKKRFDDMGIALPDSTTTLFFGGEREGKTPPIQVQLVDGTKTD
jgi:small conductance mechanosensitive channel